MTTIAWLESRAAEISISSAELKELSGVEVLEELEVEELKGPDKLQEEDAIFAPSV